MKTPEVILQEIKDQVAFENDWIDWVCFKSDCDITDIEIVTDIVAKRFAVEMAKEALKNASERDGCTFYENRKAIPYVAKELILDENNIPKL